MAAIDSVYFYLKMFLQTGGVHVCAMRTILIPIEMVRMAHPTFFPSCMGVLVFFVISCASYVTLL
jgi:hypothetical protein